MNANLEAYSTTTISQAGLNKADKRITSLFGLENVIGNTPCNRLPLDVLLQ